MSEKNSPCFSTSIDLSLSEKLKADLIEQDFEISSAPYMVFQAKKSGISLSLYNSGKLTVQGKNKHDFITFYLEPEILESVAYSYPLKDVPTHARIGIDEAGKGDFFGPLCIGGLYISGEEELHKLLSLGVKDSKKLSDPKILEIAAKIKSHFKTSVIKLFPAKYNELYKAFHNLNRLLAWGHSAAIENLHQATDCRSVIIDQFADESLVLNALKRKHLDIDLTQRHKGESDPVVAGASILARAAFVEGIESLEKEFNLTLPKGASNGVKEAARKAILIYGEQILEKISKTHFKTTSEVLS
jgi:ribonuclease HIII